MNQSLKIAKDLARHIASMGYTLDGKKMPHGHALEVVSKVVGLPNWDALSGLLSKTSSSSVVKNSSKGVLHLYSEGIGMGCPNEYSPCPDVVAIIDMDTVWNAAAVLHANKGLLESVRADANYRLGDNVDGDEFTPYGAWVDIYTTNDDGSPKFAMFCIQQKYTDDVHSKGLYFNHLNCGDWERAWVDDSSSDKAVYVARHGNTRIEKCLFCNTGRFATDHEDEDMVMKIDSLSQELIGKMHLSLEDIQHYEFVGEKKMKCFFCFDSGYEVPATRVMPQSVDEENTIEMFACCDGHASDWWDDTDWDGRHLEIPLNNQPNTVIFHDRGAGKEFRHFIEGKIILRENADNEVLGSELSEAVERLIAKGQFSGVTTDPCHPEWTLAYVTP